MRLEDVIDHERARTPYSQDTTERYRRPVAERTDGGAGDGAEDELDSAEQRRRTSRDTAVGSHRKRRRIRHHDAVRADEQEQRHENPRKASESRGRIDEEKDACKQRDSQRHADDASGIEALRQKSIELR